MGAFDGIALRENLRQILRNPPRARVKPFAHSKIADTASGVCGGHGAIGREENSIFSAKNHSIQFWRMECVEFKHSDRGCLLIV